MFLSYVIQTSADCDKIWYTVSGINLPQSNVNAFNLTWIIFLHYLLKEFYLVWKFQCSVWNTYISSSAKNNSQQILAFFNQRVAKRCRCNKYLIITADNKNDEVCKYYVMIIILLFYFYASWSRILLIRSLISGCRGWIPAFASVNSCLIEMLLFLFCDIFFSALEALRNALYKCSTYLLTYLIFSKIHWGLHSIL